MFQICATFIRKLDLSRQTMPPFLHLITELQKLFLPVYFFTFCNSLGCLFCFQLHPTKYKIKKTFLQQCVCSILMLILGMICSAITCECRHTSGHVVHTVCFLNSLKEDPSLVNTGGGECLRLQHFKHT